MSKTMLYLDTKFTELSQKTKLISLGIVSEEGYTFYAETYLKRSELSPWHIENILPNLRFEHISDSDPQLDFEHHAMKASAQVIGYRLVEWLGQFEQAEIMCDVYAYDWMLFCELFPPQENPAERLPRNISYIPLDLATLLWAKGLDPDLDRIQFSELTGKKHNALFDAKVQRAIHHKLIMKETSHA